MSEHFESKWLAKPETKLRQEGVLFKRFPYHDVVWDKIILIIPDEDFLNPFNLEDDFLLFNTSGFFGMLSFFVFVILTCSHSCIQYLKISAKYFILPLRCDRMNWMRGIEDELNDLTRIALTSGWIFLGTWTDWCKGSYSFRM